MRLLWIVALLGVGFCVAKEETKAAQKDSPANPERKELLMVEIIPTGDSRDKRQTSGEADFSGKEVPPEYLSLLQQLQLQGAGDPTQAQLQAQAPVQQYYIAKTPSGVISGGPLDRSPQRFLPSPGEPRPFRPRDPTLNILSRQNSALQAEYQRKAIRDQETVFLAPRGPQGADGPRAGPLALSGLYRPGAGAPLPPQGIPVPPGTAVGLAQPSAAQLAGYNGHDARLREALQGAQVIQSPTQQFASPAYIQQLQSRGLAQLSNGPAAELSLVREAAQQLQSRQPHILQQQQQQQLHQHQQQQQPQPQQINYQELSPAELRFVQRQQEQEQQERYVVYRQPQLQQLQQLQLQRRPQPEPQPQTPIEEQYLRETTPGGPPPPPPSPVQVNPSIQPSPLYLQQVQHLAQQQAFAQQQQQAAAAAAQQQLSSEEVGVQYIHQQQPTALRYAPQAVSVPQSTPPPQRLTPVTTPRSSIYVSTATSPGASKPKPQPATLRRPTVTIEQLLAAQNEAEPKSVPVVRIPSAVNQKPLTQADLQQLIDAGFDVSPVADPNPTGSLYFRSNAGSEYAAQAQSRFAPIVVPEQSPRLSARQRQALAQAQEEAYLQTQGVRLGSSGN